MATATPANSAVVTHTITLAGLVTSATLVAGREGTAIDNNATDDAIDAMVGGFVTTGTTPTAGQIQIWLYGSYDGTSYSGGATGTDATLTPQSVTLMRLLIAIPTTSTSNQKYTWGPYSVAAAFGGSMPRKWGVFVTHNTVAALNATGSNHEVKHTPVKIESA